MAVDAETLPLVILVHGTRDQGASFERAAAVLDDVEVVSYDRRGWGDGRGAPWDGTHAGLAGHTDDVLAILGERRATIVGHSWGGNVALAAAIRRPDLVRSVGVWETAMPWAPWWQGAHRSLILAAIDQTTQKPPGTARQNRERTLFAAEATEALSPLFDLGRFTAGCVAGYGTATRPHFGVGMRAFAEQTGAEVFELVGATHMAHRDHPEDFARFVRHALARRPPRP
jgi:pimeloyl-ACP methyl ester carboxylesterase